jgi:hypothetical protein
MAKLIQPSMAGGEVSAAVGARVDLAKRAVAVELGLNFIATFTGAARSRPGQEFVARCKPGSGAHRILDFEFSTDQTYVIELGDEYVRFHTNGAQILDSSAVKTITGATQADPVVITSTAHGLSNGDEVFIDDVVGMTELNGRSFLIANVAANTFELQTLGGVDVDGTGYTAYSSGGTATPPYELATPWPDTVLEDIGYGQSGDVMTLCHPSYPPRELVRVANDNWTLEIPAFEPVQQPPTALAGTVRTDFAPVDITAITQADPGVITTNPAHGLEVGDRIDITGIVGMVELNNFEFEVISVPSTTTCTIARVGDGTEIDTTGLTAYSSGGTLTPALRTRSYAVTAISQDDGEESLTSTGRSVTITAATAADPVELTFDEGHGFDQLEEVYISGVGGMTQLNGRRFKVNVTGLTTVELRSMDGADLDGTGFDAFTSGGEAFRTRVKLVGSADSDWSNTIEWAEVAGADAYRIYATDNFATLGFLGETEGLRFEDKNLAPDYTVTPPRSFNPFDDIYGDAGVYPSTVGFFEQRRYLGNSDNNPNRFWASQVGYFSNFSRSIPVQAGDSIIGSIAARRINEIRHILPLSDLAFLTSGGEYRAFAPEGGVISPTTINVKPQSYYGSTKVRPLVAGDVGLFVTPGQFIRDFKYQFSDDKFLGKDITILARHLFDYNIVKDWDFAPSPYYLGFVVRDDGMGLWLTYQPEQDVYAWSRSVTRGKYTSTCVVREGENDVIYATVQRTINGESVTFIERFDPHKFTTLEDAFCVDAGLTLDNPITITGVTAADPVVVTAPGHGLSNGDTVDISDVMEVSSDASTPGEVLSTDYNGTTFTIANVTTDTFELQNAGSDYDGSGFAAYSSGGKVRQAVTTVSGLWHLEGETVVAAANGYAEVDLVVTNGQVTLGSPASRVHVGLPYTCRLISLPLETYADSRQTSKGTLKNISRLTVEVERTMGFWFGPSVDQMREARFGLPQNYGQPLQMVTEQIDVTMKPDWGKKKQVVIEQRAPLPCSVLSLIPDVQGGGN